MFHTIYHVDQVQNNMFLEVTLGHMKSHLRHQMIDKLFKRSDAEGSVLVLHEIPIGEDSELTILRRPLVHDEGFVQCYC